MQTFQKYPPPKKKAAYCSYGSLSVFYYVQYFTQCLWLMLLFSELVLFDNTVLFGKF